MASRRSSLDRCQLLRMCIGEEQCATEALHRRAEDLLDGCGQASEELRIAMQSCEDQLASLVGNGNLLQERDLCLGERLASREDLQALLIGDINEAAQELRKIHDSHSSVLHELTVLRHENTSL